MTTHSRIISVMFGTVHHGSTTGEFGLTVHENYHWQELSQVSFLSPQKFCHDKHVFVATTVCLSWQNCLSWQIFVVTKVFCDKHNFVATSILLLCATKDVFCHDKHMCVTTNTCLSWQDFCPWTMSCSSECCFTVYAHRDCRDYYC